jgi:hypothetical protein
VYIENLVFDVQIARVSGNDRTDHISPSLYQPIFIQGRFQPVLTEEFPDHIAYLFGIVPSHASSPFRS